MSWYKLLVCTESVFIVSVVSRLRRPTKGGARDGDVVDVVGRNMSLPNLNKMPPNYNSNIMNNAVGGGNRGGGGPNSARGQPSQNGYNNNNNGYA